MRWARAYVEFAAGEKRSWLAGHGLTFLPTVGWAERGDLRADGHGNSVPRFHVTWGTGTGVVEPFVAVGAGGGRGRAGHVPPPAPGRRARRQPTARSPGCAARCWPRTTRPAAYRPTGTRSASSSSAPRSSSSRPAASAPTTTWSAATGRHGWARRRRTTVTGVPAYVDGRMLDIAADAGVRLVNRDRMWHYTEGVQNWNPIWPGHGIRILPGPSSIWFDALGRRLPDPCLPGYDTLGTLKHLRTTPRTSRRTTTRGSSSPRRSSRRSSRCRAPSRTPTSPARDRRAFLRERLLSKGAPAPVEAFKQQRRRLRRGRDAGGSRRADERADRRGRCSTRPDPGADRGPRPAARQPVQQGRPGAGHPQRAPLPRRPARPGRHAAPILDPAAGPLIGVKLHILTRKTLGGIQTDLDSRALGADGQPIGGLYAAGEVAGFGGGGVHGYNALEGTFLGGCLFSGRAAGRDAARQL